MHVLNVFKVKEQITPPHAEGVFIKRWYQTRGKSKGDISHADKDFDDETTKPHT